MAGRSAYDQFMEAHLSGKDIDNRELTQREQDLLRLEQFRLMDDDFFSEALDEKNEAVGYILNTILGRNDLVVTSTKAQVEYKSAVKRSIRLDIKAVDADGEVADIEIQRADRGSGVRRARYHSSMIDRTLLSKNEDFEDLPDTYVIFITENDKFGRGKPLYHIERRIEEMDDALFDDGAHIIYVNGEFQDADHPIGRLMHDFHCTKAGDMYSSILADEVRYLKETEGGRSHMCKAMEEMRMEAAEAAVHKDRIENALKMIASDRLTHQEIAEWTGLALSEVEELAGQKTA